MKPPTTATKLQPETFEQLDEEESYWLYDIVKKLHNSGKNAMLMSEVRNQRHVWLSILLGVGHSMADINSADVRGCVKDTERHTHRDAQIDFTSGTAPIFQGAWKTGG